MFVVGVLHTYSVKWKKNVSFIIISSNVIGIFQLSLDKSNDFVS